VAVSNLLQKRAFARGEAQAPTVIWRQQPSGARRLLLCYPEGRPERRWHAQGPGGDV